VDANTGPGKLFSKSGGKSLDRIADLLNEAEASPEIDAELAAVIAGIRKRTGNKDGSLTGDDLGPLLGDREFMNLRHADEMADQLNAHHRSEAEDMGIDPDDPLALDDNFNVEKFVSQLGPEPSDAGGDMDLQNLINFRKGSIDALREGKSLQGGKLTPEHRAKVVEQIADADHQIQQIQKLRGKPSAAGNQAGKPAAGAQQGLQGTDMDPALIARRADEAAAGKQGELAPAPPAERPIAEIRAELEGMKLLDLKREAARVDLLIGGSSSARKHEVVDAIIRHVEKQRSAGSVGDNSQRIRDLNDDIIAMKKEMEDPKVLFTKRHGELTKGIADAEQQIVALEGGDPPIGGAAGSRHRSEAHKGNAAIHSQERGIFGEGPGAEADARLYRESVTGKSNPMEMTGKEQQEYLANLRHIGRIRTEAIAKEQNADIDALHEGGARPPEDLLGDLGKVEALDPDIPAEFMQEIPPGYNMFQTPTSESNLSGTFIGSLLVRGGRVPDRLRKFFTKEKTREIVHADGTTETITEEIVTDRFLGGTEIVRLMYKELGERTTELHAIAEKAQLDVASGRRVFRALDGQIEPASLEPPLQEVYKSSRKILNDLAERLEMAPEQRISEYAPHIFSGRLGELLAQQIAGEQGMNIAASVVNFDWRGRPVSVPRVPKSKFFQHLLKRAGVEGFEQDWSMVMQAYTRGATQKIYIDQFLKEATVLLAQVPNTLTLKKEMSKYAYYVAGGTTDNKKAMARFLSDSAIFNNSVDRAMALLAPGNSKKNLGMMRDSPDELLEWYRNVVEMSHAPEGAESAGARMTRARSQATIKLDDIRAQLNDPNAGPVILSQLYRIQAWHKLGGNLAHFVTNSTQFLVNSVPELGAQAAYRGAYTFLNYQLMGQKQLKIKVGKVETPVSELLAEIRYDTPAHSEFLAPSRFGRKFAVTEDIVFSPSRWSEFWNRGATLLGKYEDALRKSGDLATTNPRQAHLDALDAGLKAEQKTQFIFNRSGTPKALRSPLARTMFMFQSYTLHQMNFSWDLFRNVAVNPSKENRTKLALHMASYAALIAPGMMAGYETSDRYSHPLVDKAEQLMGADRRGSEPQLLNFFGGPWAGSIWQTTQWILGNQDGGKFMQYAVAPAAIGRAVPREGEQPGDYVIRNITGVRPTRKGRAKDGRARAPTR
jgi:hypothetical protein